MLGTNVPSSFMDIFNEVGFHQLIKEPTRITPTSSTLIDLMFTLCPEKISNIHHLCPLGTADHDVIAFDYAVGCEVIKTSNMVIRYRDKKSIDHVAFSHVASMLNWQDVNFFDNVDDKLNFLYSLINNLLNIFAPIKTMITKKKYSPWLTKKIRKQIRRKNNAWCRFRSTRSQADWVFYKNLLKDTKRMINTEKRIQMNHFVNHNASNPRTLWSGLRNMQIIDRKISHSTTHALSDPNTVNKYFNQSVHHGNAFTPSNLNVAENRIAISMKNFDLSSVTSWQVLDAVQSLSKSSKGNDNISMDEIKLCIPFCINALTDVINFSLYSGTVPSAWKTSIISPIPKVTHAVSIEQYRPISILPAMSKILERIVHKQVDAHLEEGNLYYEKQSGFRKDHSTTTALLHTINFSKAFDTVNHSTLITKLTSLGFSRRASNWFKDYLCDRNQRTKIVTDG
ncbi:uncharacterized protein LOC116165788 [Photinus pyralis]|uniref:uncharacterized protein LOC116165788 n=1 Tax=Photinus pyralis TaxID=7054 RepID=UPI0012675B4C|nr:uncharacterized protein LOC116165788 [Photinus pyralis]